MYNVFYVFNIVTGYALLSDLPVNKNYLIIMNSTSKNPMLLDEMRTKLCREGYAYSTENSYCDWVRRFVKFHAFKSREAMLVDSSQKVEQSF